MPLTGINCAPSYSNMGASLHNQTHSKLPSMHAACQSTLSSQCQVSKPTLSSAAGAVLPSGLMTGTIAAITRSASADTL